MLNLYLRTRSITSWSPNDDEAGTERHCPPARRQVDGTPTASVYMLHAWIEQASAQNRYRCAASNSCLIPQAAELEVKAAQLREEDYQRELSSQGESLEQRAAELDRLGKVRGLCRWLHDLMFLAEKMGLQLKLQAPSHLARSCLASHVAW